MKPVPFALGALALLSLSGCIQFKTQSDGITRLRIGESGAVDGPTITPLRLVDDSRCPAKVQCVWAGEVRIVVRIETGQGSETREIVTGKPIPVADGSLALVEVYPDKREGETLYPEEYRFGFKFDGGL